MVVEHGLHVVLVPAWWPSAERPGAGIFFVDYVGALIGAGIRVGVVYPDLVSLRSWRREGGASLRPRVSLEQTGGANVVRVRGLHTALGRPELHMRRFRSWLRRGLIEYEARFGKAPVLHAMCAVPSGWSCLGMGHKVVLTEHSGPPAAVWKKAGEMRMAMEAIAGADRVVTVSPLNQRALRAAGISREVLVCGNPVAGVFVESGIVGRKAHRPPRVLFVGRLIDEKGVRELTEAAAALRDVPCEWHLGGDGPRGDWIRRGFAAAGLEDRLHMHGHVDRLPLAALMGEMDLFVLPSYRETFGLAVAEAMCMGLPVVTTRGPACAEFVGEADGVLVDGRDAGSLAEGVGRALKELGRFDRAGIAARARARFSAVAVGEFHRKLYEGLVKV